MLCFTEKLLAESTLGSSGYSLADIAEKLHSVELHEMLITKLSSISKVIESLGIRLVNSLKSLALTTNSPSPSVSALIVVRIPISRLYEVSSISFSDIFTLIPSSAGIVDFGETALDTLLIASLSSVLLQINFILLMTSVKNRLIV